VSQKSGRDGPSLENMPKRFFPAITSLLLVSTYIVVTASAQGTSQKRASVSDFDLREQITARSPIRDGALVQRRTGNVESFLLTERTQRPGVRMS
jgi:hypothetical protein